MSEGRKVGSKGVQLRGEEKKVKGEEVRGEEYQKERRWEGRMEGGIEKAVWDFSEDSFRLECTTFGGGGLGIEKEDPCLFCLRQRIQYKLK
jgi:hypothetical protein